MFCLIKPVVLLLFSACFYDLILSHGVTSGFPRTMTSFRVQLPEKFDFSRQEEWPKWSRRFERFRQASGLAKDEEESQINMLIYAMGDQADDILNSFKLSITQLKQYHTVKTKFDEHFVVRRNVIFERAKFNQRRQEEGETVDTFITALHALAEHCNFGTLTDEMIRDRIVVGLLDAKLSEKLQLDPELTLPKAVNQARQSEAVKKQQTLMRNDFKESTGTKNEVDAVKTEKFRKDSRLEVRTKLPIPRNCQLVHPQIAATAVGNRRATCGKIVQLKPRFVTSARRKVTGHLFASPLKM